MEEKRKKIWIRCYLKRKAKRKPKDEEKEKALVLLDYARFKRWIEEGKIEVVGNRRYRLRI
jgi:hypothetical protein